MTVNERLKLLEELFIKMDLTIEMDSADDWEGCKDFVCYVAGDNSTFDDLYTSDEDTIELISKLKKGRKKMNKELEALNNLIRLNQDKYEKSISFNTGISFEECDKNLTTIKQALNELEDAKHNYKAVKEMYNNAVAYATEIQEELNQLKKRNEPMKPNYGGKFPECPVCKKLLHSIWQKHCDNCTQAIDWSDEK